jgi:hypothetical protein
MDPMGVQRGPYLGHKIDWLSQPNLLHKKLSLSTKLPQTSPKSLGVAAEKSRYDLILDRNIRAGVST